MLLFTSTLAVSLPGTASNPARDDGGAAFATQSLLQSESEPPTFTQLDVDLQGPGGSANIDEVAFNWSIDNDVDWVNFTIRGEDGSVVESENLNDSGDVTGTLADGETTIAIPNTANVTIQAEANGPGGSEFLAASRVDQGDSPLSLSDFHVDDEEVDFENENFVVEISSVDEEVTEGETVAVEAFVENIGFESGTQTVTLTDFDGTEQDAEVLSLGSGANETVTLTWETSAGDAGSGPLTVATENDSVETSTVTVESGETFAANASETAGSGTEDEPVTLNASASTGTIDRYEWDVDGDGTFEVNATDETVAYTYFDPGTYTLTLRATNSTGGVDTDEVTVTIDGVDDWPTAGGDTARRASNVDTDSPVTMEEKWRAAIDGTRRDAPVVWNDTVYVADGDTLRAFDTADGSPTWTFDAASRMETSPAVADGTVFVATTSGDSTLYALDAIDGTKSWETTLDGTLHSTPVVADGHVYFTNGTHVVALDATDGSEAWADPVSGDVSSRHAPAYADGTLYLPGGDVVAFDVADREVVWTHSLRTHARTSPMLADGTVVVGSNAPGVLAIDAATGKERWALEKAPTATGTMAVADGYVYRMLPRGSLQAYHVTNGTQAWSTTIGSFVPSGGIAVGTDVVYTTARTNGKAADRFDVTIVDATSGDLVSGLESPFEGPREIVRSPPAVSNGTVYVVGRDLLALTGDVPPTARASSQAVDDPDPRIRLDGTNSTFDHGFANVTWDLGDGTTFTNESESGLEIEHTYDEAGTYRVTMTVADQNGLSDTDTITVTVRARSLLVADAGNDTVVDEGEAVTFESLGVVEAGIDRIEWDFDGDGTIDETTTEPNVTHVYDEPGRYTLVMRVIDAEGNVGTDTVEVTVRDVTAPDVQFAVFVDDQQVATADGEGTTGTVEIDEGTAVAFDASDSTDNVAVAGYEWDFDDDGVVDDTGPEPTYVYEDPGTYQASVTVVDADGNEATTAVTVTVNDTTPPTTRIAVAGIDDGAAETGDVITFDGSNSTDNVGVTGYEWDFGDGNTTSGSVVNHSYASNGTYTVVLTAIDDAGNEAVANVTVEVVDGVPLVADAGPDRTIVREAGEEGNLTVELNASGSAPPDSITNYRWEFDGTVIADGPDETNVVHEFEPPESYPANYTVTLEVTDGNATATDTALVRVEREAPLPVASATVNRSEVNTTESVEFNASESLDGDGSLSYAWDFGDGTDATGEVVTHSYVAPGVYEVRLVVEDQAGNVDDTLVTVVVADATLPIPTITANRTSVGIGEHVGFDGSGSTDNDEIESFEWNFDDGLLARGQTATHGFATPGTFEVTLTVVDASGNENASSVEVTVVDDVAPEANAGPDRTAVVNESVTFDGSNATDNVEVTDWEWDFEDGSNATGRVVTHSYDAPGTYTVNQTVSDGSGNQDTDTATVTVEDGVSVDGETFDLTNSGGTVLDVTFEASLPLDSIVVNVTDAEGTVVATLNETDFGDPTGEYTYHATVDVGEDGEYTATLEEATDAYGNDGASDQSDTTTVDTTPPTVSGFDVTNPSGQNVTISLTSDEPLETIVVDVEGAENVTLTVVDFDESDDGAGNYTYTTTYEGSTDGTYDVTLETAEDVAGNDGATDQTDSVEVDTTVPTISGFDLSNPDGQNLTVSFATCESLDAITVDLVGPENATLNAVDFTETDDGEGNFTYNATYEGGTDGNYTATLETAEDAAGNDGSAGESATVTVDTTPPTLTDVVASNPDGQNVTVSLGSDEPLATIVVNLTGAESATLTEDDFAGTDEGDGNHTYEATYVGSTDGNYTTTVTTAEDAAGNDGAADQFDTVSVGDLEVVARADASSYVTGVGSTVELRANDSTVPDGSTPTYEWDVGEDGTTDYTGAVATHTFNSTGTTNVSLTVTVNGVSSTDNLSIGVRDETDPSVTLSADDPADVGETITFDASGSSDDVGIDSYEWDFGDGSTDSGKTLTNPTHSYDDPGHYEVTVTATDAAGNDESNSTTVLVLGPEANVSTTALSFGTVATGSTNTDVVRVENTGTVPLNVTGSSFAGDNASAFALAGSSATELPVVRPGETRSVTVAFSPDSAGSKNATLTLTTNETGAGPIDVSLDGTGVESDLRSSPTNVSFGEVDVGDTRQEMVSLETVGGVDVDVVSVGVVGPDADQFAVVDDDGLPATVPDGGDHDVTVAFEPTATGEQTATLQVETADGSLVGVPLDGHGVGPDVRLSTDRIDFAPIGKGDTAVTSVDVSNYGTRPLAVDDVTIEGEDAGNFSVGTLPSTIAPGKTESIEVSFSPDLAGEFEASLEVATNDSDEPTSAVSLDGTAVGANVGIDRRTVNFGNVTLGQTVYMNLTVRNQANSKANLTVSRTPIVGSDRDSFEINRGGGPFTLAPGESQEIELAFTPLTSGIKQAQLQVISDAGNEPQIDVWLSNTRTYIVVQEVDDSATVNVDGNNVVADNDLSINVSRPRTRERGVGFDQLETTYKPGGDFELDVVHADQPVGSDGETYAENGTDVVQYVRLNHSVVDPDATYDNTTVHYRVEKRSLPSWVDPTDVTLSRWNETDGQWNEMPVEYLRESRTHYFYVVDTPGFSQFVVGAPSSPADGGGGSSVQSSTNFTVTSTAANATDVLVGESVAFDATVTNDGTAGGTFTAEWTIDGEGVASQSVFLSPGESETVTFVESFDEPGEYEVAVSDESVATVTVSHPDEQSGSDPDDPSGDDTPETPSTPAEDDPNSDESTPDAGTPGGTDVGEPVDPGPDDAGTIPFWDRVFGGEDECELFGLDLGRFIVCWYWWMLAAVLLVGGYLLYVLARRRREEDEQRDRLA